MATSHQDKQDAFARQLAARLDHDAETSAAYRSTRGAGMARGVFSLAQRIAQGGSVGGSLC